MIPAPSQLIKAGMFTAYTVRRLRLIDDMPYFV